MGNCTNNDQRTPIIQEKNKYNTVPPDTQELKDKPLPKLDFYFQLSRIKIKNCQNAQIYTKFKIADIQQYTTPLKKKDQYNNVYWKVQHVSQCTLTEYELRHRFVTIQVYGPQNELQGSISVNMYLIWNGPSQIDLQLESSHQKRRRVSFNFKISQGIHFKIQNLSTTLIRSQRPFPEECFSFWIQPIVPIPLSKINQQLQPSNHTYLLKIKDRSPLGRSSDHVQTYTTTADRITWLNENAKQLKFPIIQQHIFSHQVRQSALQVTFFKVIFGPQKKNHPRFHIQSECFISIPKLLTTDYRIWKDNKSNITYQQFFTTVTEKTWNQEKQVGQATLTMKIILQTHQKQMLTCIRTQKGIELSNSLLVSEKIKQSEEIIALKRVLDELQANILELEQSSDQRQSSVLREIITNIVSLLAQLQSLIARTSRESAVTYQYANQLQMIHAQKVIVEVALKVLSYIREEIHPDIQQKSWQVLINILKRSELTLVNIGFSKQRKKKIEMKQFDEVIQRKIQVALKYQQLLHQLLQMTLDALIFKGEEAQSTFAQTFCAYAYFRVPVFRDHLLSAITKKDDPQLSQWRFIEQNNNKEQGLTESQYFQVYDGLLNWEKHFYQCLSSNSKFKSNQLHIKGMLDKQIRWRQRLSKRKGVFYTFIQNLVKEVQSVCSTNVYIQWQYIPGYHKILHAFLVQMKSIKLTSVNDRFKRCCLKLLSNQRLLNVFTIILMKKTNSYESDSTLITIELLSQFFQELRKSERQIPSTFDYKFFLTGIKTILESQYEYNISQIIVLLYNNFYFLSQGFSLQLLLYILSKYFFRFFLHWSFHLRRNFHTLIFLRAENLNSMKKKQNKDSSYISFLKIFISQRYQHLSKLIKQQTTHLGQQNNQIFYQSTFHKRMKVKMTQNIKYLKKQFIKAPKKLFQVQSLAVLRSHSQGTSSRLLIPRTKIYFQQEELQQAGIKSAQISYLKAANLQFKNLTQLISKKRLDDPKFEPQLKLKKVIDAKQYGPTKIQDW